MGEELTPCRLQGYPLYASCTVPTSTERPRVGNHTVCRAGLCTGRIHFPHSPLSDPLPPPPKSHHSLHCNLVERPQENTPQLLENKQQKVC